MSTQEPTSDDIIVRAAEVIVDAFASTDGGGLLPLDVCVP